MITAWKLAGFQAPDLRQGRGKSHSTGRVWDHTKVQAGNGHECCLRLVLDTSLVRRGWNGGVRLALRQIEPGRSMGQSDFEESILLKFKREMT